jgi:hypothetical protein
MFGSVRKWKWLAAAFVVLTIAGVATSAEAQTVHHTRRETNAIRKARIERTIAETYNHRWELSGGGGFLRFRSGEYLQRNSQVTWLTGVSYNINPKWSAIGDIRGSYGNAKVQPLINNPEPISGVYNPLISQYTFMFGPQYRFYAKQKLTASVNVLGGIAMGNFDGGSKGIPAPVLGMWSTSNVAAFSANLNVDYNFYPNLAFRVTPTYVGTTFRSIDQTNGQSIGSIQNNLGINFGVIYRFGKIKK